MWYIIIILALIILITSYFIFRLAICRNSKKELIFRSKFNNASTEGRLEIKNDIKWFKKSHKEVSIHSVDNLLLKGYLIKNKKNNKYVIVVHGFTSSHLEMINRAQKFNDLGYNVLLVDLRGHGKSEGKYITMGVKDSIDLKSWSEYLVKKQGAKKIVLYGVSMGAASVMMSLDKDLPNEVTNAIEDCGYTTIYSEYKYQFKNLFHIYPFPFLNLCNLFAILIAGFNFRNGNAIKSISKTNIPLLMIHGTKDTFVPYYMLDELDKNCASEHQTFIVKGANHTEAQNLDYENYWKTVDNFIK